MSWDTSIDWTAPLTRRSVLRGAGAVLALPFLESWVHALGKAADHLGRHLQDPLPEVLANRDLGEGRAQLGGGRHPGQS